MKMSTSRGTDVTSFGPMGQAVLKAAVEQIVGRLLRGLHRRFEVILCLFVLLAHVLTVGTK